MAKYIPFPMTAADRPKEEGWYVIVNQQMGKLYTLEYWGPHRYSPEHLSCVARLYFQAWAFGGCSANALWGFYHIQHEQYYTEEFVYGFMKTLKELWDMSGYDAKRVFVQAPAGKEGIFKYILQLTGQSELRPAYKFENKSHTSSEQRLFDVPSEDWWEWMNAYEKRMAEKEKGLSQKAALKAAMEKANEKVSAGGRVAAVVVGNGTGMRPIAPGEFRPAQARDLPELDF